MEMKKNYILATVLIFLVIIGSTYIQHKFFPQPEVLPEDPRLTSNEEKPVESASTILIEKPVVDVVSADETEVHLTEQTYVVETDLIRATFTNRGGDIISYKLKRHNISGSTENVEMIENISDTNRALSISLGQFGTSAISQLFSVQQDTDAQGNELISFFTTLKLKNTNGEEEIIKLGKHYKFLPNEYMFELVVTVDGSENFSGLGFNNVAYNLRTAPQIGPHWNKSDRYDFRQFSSYIDGKHKATRLKAGANETITNAATWTAVSGKYFTFVVVPETPVANITYSAFSADPKDKKTIENSQIFISRLATNGKLEDLYRIYIGPSSEKSLGIYSNPVKNKFGYANLNIDEIPAGTGFFSGILNPVIVVVKFLLEMTYKLVKNWGVAIILVTILIKLLLFPLSWKTMLGTQRLQPYQPKLQEVQAKYRSNPQKMQEEMGKIYAQAGYKPGCVSGCLPYLLQFAVIIAMFQLFNNYFEFRGASFISGWISDLSVGDSIYTFRNPLPLLHWTDLRLLPIIYVATTYTSSLLNKQAVNEQTKSMMFMMMYVMPGIFFFILYNAPSGLFVYWIVSNLLMIVQQLVIRELLKKEQNKKRK